MPATISDTILDETPFRALKFFGAVSTNPYIRAALNARGYTDAIHERAWELVLLASGYNRPTAAAPAKPEASAAIAELDAWDEPNFRVAKAALDHEFPDQASFVFDGLAPQTGVAAVVSVTTFLDRLDDLESGKDRKETKKADKAALDKLAQRGITAEKRAHLRALLQTAMGSPEPIATSAAGAAGKEKADKAAETRRNAKIALRAIYVEWSEIAKADIKRRDHLIQLGLAARKVKAQAKKPNPTGAGGDK